MRRQDIHCLGCGNEAVIVIKDADVTDHIEYCPFCGADLMTEEDIHDLLGDDGDESDEY